MTFTIARLWTFTIARMLGDDAPARSYCEGDVLEINWGPDGGPFVRVVKVVDDVTIEVEPVLN